MSDSPKGPIIRNKATGKVTTGKPANSPANPQHRPPPSDALPAGDVTLEQLPGMSPPAHSEQSSPELPIQAIPQNNKPPSTVPQKKASPPRENLEQFITFVYSRQGKQVTLKPAEEKAFCHQPRLDEAAHARLLALARDDVLLAVPRQLLLIVRDIMGYPGFKAEIRNFVRAVLDRHPVFAAPELKAALSHHPDAPDPETALTRLAGSDVAAQPDFALDKPLKPKELAALRTNATYCLALWFVETRGLPFERLNQVLYAALWKPHIPEVGQETARLRFLTEMQDLAGVGLACSTFKRQADEQTKRTATANRARDDALEKVARLEATATQLKHDLVERDQRLAALQHALEVERQQHAHTRAHLGDDFEQLRTRMVRRLKADVDLLMEGLQALRRDPPKIHVMDDHAERALGALQQALKELETED